MTTDALAAWCQVRQQVDWSKHGAEVVTDPIPACADGFVAWVDGVVRRRDPDRAERLLCALALVYADSAQESPLTFGLIAGWQRLVLSATTTPFRDGDAYAKGGRERYGLMPHTQTDFARYLLESADSGVSLPARAARAYLDVIFFHPFADGNARAALLTLAFVLRREGVMLDQVGPLQTARYADDPAGAAAFADLVGVLICATRRRATASRHDAHRARSGTRR
ncbi:Fic family protein [Nonomuraea angiospora]|uniref:Fic family protein n=1 Tax=Nonomuraea angiospora TaxID=46172 RepID=UPI0033CEB686